MVWGRINGSFQIGKHFVLNMQHQLTSQRDEWPEYKWLSSADTLLAGGLRNNRFAFGINCLVV